MRDGVGRRARDEQRSSCPFILLLVQVTRSVTGSSGTSGTAVPHFLHTLLHSPPPSHPFILLQVQFTISVTGSSGTMQTARTLAGSSPSCFVPPTPRFPTSKGMRPKHAPFPLPVLHSTSLSPANSLCVTYGNAGYKECDWEQRHNADRTHAGWKCTLRLSGGAVRDTRLPDVMFEAEGFTKKVGCACLRGRGGRGRGANGEGEEELGREGTGGLHHQSRVWWLYVEGGEGGGVVVGGRCERHPPA